MSSAETIQLALQSARLASRNGQFETAISYLRQALELFPDTPEICNELGATLRASGNLDAAVTTFRQAADRHPNRVDIQNNLGVVLLESGLIDQAIQIYIRVTTLDPTRGETWSNLGNALREKGDLTGAISAYERGLQLHPAGVELLNNLAAVHEESGEQDQAIACYETALSHQPGAARIHSNLVYSLHFHPRYDAKAILAEHVRWARQHADPLKPFIHPHDNDPSPNRRLRIGYVSPDLRQHVIGRFLLPLLENHDHENVEIFCYSSSSHAPDAISEQLRAVADHWRSITGLSDEHAAEIIRRDQIDILIDLSAHMAKNRQLVFARKPAPVQVTYLAYCGTTGQSGMDYRITDPWLDPPGKTIPIIPKDQFVCRIRIGVINRQFR